MLKLESTEKLYGIQENIEDAYYTIQDEFLETLKDERDNHGVHRPHRSVISGANIVPSSFVRERTDSRDS